MTGLKFPLESAGGEDGGVLGRGEVTEGVPSLVPWEIARLLTTAGGGPRPRKNSSFLSDERDGSGCSVSWRVS